MNTENNITDVMEKYYIYRQERITRKQNRIFISIVTLIAIAAGLLISEYDIIMNVSRAVLRFYGKLFNLDCPF